MANILKKSDTERKRIPSQNLATSGYDLSPKNQDV